MVDVELGGEGEVLRCGVWKSQHRQAEFGAA